MVSFDLTTVIRVVNWLIESWRVSICGGSKQFGSHYTIKCGYSLAGLACEEITIFLKKKGLTGDSLPGSTERHSQTVVDNQCRITRKTGWLCRCLSWLNSAQLSAFWDFHRFKDVDAIAYLSLSINLFNESVDW